MRKPVKKGIIYTCLCNCVTEAEIRQAVRMGHDTLDKIQNFNFATVGPCGGSCLQSVIRIIEDEVNQIRFEPS